MTRHCHQRPPRGPIPVASARPAHPALPRPHGHLIPLNLADRETRPSASPPPGDRAPARPRARDRATGWLRGAMASLAVLAAAAAVVSWDAQYVMVRTVKHSPAVAALEAGIPDIGAVIFAALGIALALHGRRAVRARALNVGCVAISLAMNALASAPGWRDLAIWVMPSAVYALASDTLIGVVRAWVIARTRSTGQALADDEPTPIALIGGAVLWLIRLAVAPASTVTGFRRWIVDECPVAPGRKAPRARQQHKHRSAEQPPRAPIAVPPRRGTKPGKQARLIDLAGRRHDLASVPLTGVSRIASTIAAEIDLAPGTARRVLLAHVRALHDTSQADSRQPEEARS